MRLKTWALGALALGASALVAMPSGAKPGDQGSPHAEDRGDRDRHDHGKRDHDRGHDDEHAGARDDHEGKGKEGDDDEKWAPERREFRRGLFERNQKSIIEQLNRERLQMTDEVRAAVQMHWRHLARLVRIRELAAAAKEEAIVKRVDLVIDHEEKAFTLRLDKLHDNVRPEGGAR